MKYDLTTERTREIKHAIISAINDVYVRHGGDTNIHIETYETIVHGDIWGANGEHVSFDIDVNHEKTDAENYRTARHETEQALIELGMEFMTSEEIFLEQISIQGGI